MDLKKTLIIALIAIAGFFMFSKKAKAADKAGTVVPPLTPGATNEIATNTNVVTRIKRDNVIYKMNDVNLEGGVVLRHNQSIDGYWLSNETFEYIYNTPGGGKSYIIPAKYISGLPPKA